MGLTSKASDPLEHSRRQLAVFCEQFPLGEPRAIGVVIGICDGNERRGVERFFDGAGNGSSTLSKKAVMGSCYRMEMTS